MPNSAWCIAPVSFELLGIGRKLADQRGVPLSAVLFGYGVEEHAPSLIACGADIVYFVDDRQLEHFREDVYGKVFEELARTYKPEVVLAGATAIGRSFIPLVANVLNAGLTADCTQLAIREEDGMLLQTRPAFGGNIMATIECPHSRPQMATVRPKVMKPAEPDPSRQGELIRIIPSAEALESQVQVLETVRSEQDNVNIQEVEILVSGGRGLENEKGFDLIQGTC